jgi:hypothetical protein
MAHHEELIAVTQIGLVGKRHWRGVRSVVCKYEVTVHINLHYLVLKEQQNSSSQNIRRGTLEYGTMCPGVDSASENEYQGFLLG